MVKKGSAGVGGQGDSHESGGGMGGDGVETGACIFGEFELWRNPATLIEYWCYVYMEVYRLQNRLHNLDSTWSLQMKV